MSTFRLRLSARASVPALTLREFLWRPPPLGSSLQTNIGPRLEALGPISELHADFVRLAALVYLVDRTAPRPGRGWERELELEVPVSDADRWNDFADALADQLRFLSGDTWTLRFERQRLPRRGDVRDVADDDARVCLFSGGADSLAGAVVLGEKTPLPTLISHWDWPIVSGIQQRLVAELARLWGTEVEHQQVRIGRRTHQLGSGDEFHQEGSSRSRSFLFIALGLAAASVRGGQLTIAENGFASLNPPLAGERRGALSTRTTHPALLDGIEILAGEIGLTAHIENPFEGLTKGQLFGRVRQIIGADKASELLSASYSCAKPVAYRFGQRPGVHCGLCFGCLVRRAAFLAADLDDRTVYLDQVLTGVRRSRFMTDTTLETARAVRYAVRDGLDEDDLLDLGLPDRIDLSAAASVARRGLDELAKVRV